MNQGDRRKWDRFVSKAGGVGSLAEGFYAIRDPFEPNRVTLWRVLNGGFLSWPPGLRSHTGPIQTVDWAACPSAVDYEARHAFLMPVWDAQAKYVCEVQDLIEADPVGAAARFAVFQVCCCLCGRPLTDPESRGYGVGPTCRRWMPVDYLAELARRVSVSMGEANV